MQVANMRCDDQRPLQVVDLELSAFLFGMKHEFNKFLIILVVFRRKLGRRYGHALMTEAMRFGVHAMARRELHQDLRILGFSAVI